MPCGKAGLGMGGLAVGLACWSTVFVGAGRPPPQGVVRAETVGPASLSTVVDRPSAHSQRQEFVWDFTPCYDLTIRSEGTEFVDAALFGLPGGCHLRFLRPAESWLQTTFAVVNAPRAGRWSLAMLHLAVTPAGSVAGLAPVLVMLNGEPVWQGPIIDDGLGPGGVWSGAQVDVTDLVRQGGNTLRWEFLGGGAAHYWLKIVAVGWDPD
jgi:hypothetical protein